eukprot:13547765-Alexandrium_andersonii.AAC.1
MALLQECCCANVHEGHGTHKGDRSPHTTVDFAEPVQRERELCPRGLGSCVSANVQRFKHVLPQQPVGPEEVDFTGQISRRAVCSTRHATRPVSYTHLTLPTICSV